MDGSIELSFEIYESFIPIRVEVELFRSKGSLSYSILYVNLYGFVRFSVEILHIKFIFGSSFSECRIKFCQLFMYFCTFYDDFASPCFVFGNTESWFRAVKFVVTSFEFIQKV